MNKRTYIPSKPRNKNLTIVGSGGGGIGKTEFSQVAGSSHDHVNKSVLDQITEALLTGALRDLITSTDTTSILTDDNYLSSLRVLAEITANNTNITNELKTLFLSKLGADAAQGLITFLEGIISKKIAVLEKGWKTADFVSGLLGAGASVQNVNGSTVAEVDQLVVRQRAEFLSVLIREAKHIGGELVISAADMLCTKVEDKTGYYRCYFDANDGKVTNLFENTDYARCQVFTGTGQKFYWRKVITVGLNYIDLSKTDYATGSGIPVVGDSIFQLGSTNVNRQGAIILSTVGTDAPSIKQYAGISTYDLTNKEITVFSGLGNKIDGKSVFHSSGESIEDEVDSKTQVFFSKPTKYKKFDVWILSSDIVLNNVSYKKGQILHAVYETKTDFDWRLMQLEDETKTTDGINLVRNYDFRYGLSLWGGVGEIGETTEIMPTDFYNPTTEVWGDEYGYEYAVTNDNDELIELA